MASTFRSGNENDSIAPMATSRDLYDNKEIEHSRTCPIANDFVSVRMKCLKFTRRMTHSGMFSSSEALLL